MKYFPFLPIVACSVLTVAQPAATAAQSQSAFLPAAGQTVHYLLSDTMTTPDKTTTSTARLTLTAADDGRVRVEVVGEGAQRSNAEFRVEQNGSLELVSAPEPIPSGSGKHASSDQMQRLAREQALIVRLGLVSRISAHSSENASFPALLYVPWASGPVSPLLTITPHDLNTFAADAHGVTFIYPPPGKSHVMRSALVSLAVSTGIGAGLEAVGGTAAAVAGAGLTVVGAVIQSKRRPEPLPTDVTLRVTGQLIEGRLNTLSGDEEYIVHAKKHIRNASDKWSLVRTAA